MGAVIGDPDGVDRRPETREEVLVACAHLPQYEHRLFPSAYQVRAIFAELQSPKLVRMPEIKNLGLMLNRIKSPMTKTENSMIIKKTKPIMFFKHGKCPVR